MGRRVSCTQKSTYVRSNSNAGTFKKNVKKGIGYLKGPHSLDFALTFLSFMPALQSMRRFFAQLGWDSLRVGLNDLNHQTLMCFRLALHSDADRKRLCMKPSICNRVDNLENNTRGHADKCPASDKELKTYIYELILAIEAYDTPRVEELLRWDVPPKWHDLAKSIAGPYLDGMPLDDPLYRLCLDANKELAQSEGDE